MQAIQQTRGVDYVDVDLLDSIAEDAALADLTNLLSTLSLRQRITVRTGRVDYNATDPAQRLLPAQIAYLNPDVPDTLILTEIEP